MNGRRWHRAAALALVACIGAAAPAPAQHPGIDVRLYIFHVTLPDSGDEVRGRAIVHFARARGTDTLRLDLVGMTVDSVKAAPTPTAIRLPYRHDGLVLRVALVPWIAGDIDWTVAVWYHGVPSDGLIIRDNARGRRAIFGDNWPNRARHWLPTVDHPSDKASVRWEIEAPRRWSVVANGQRLLAESLPGGRQRVVFAEDQTPVYTMVIGATELGVRRRRDLRVLVDPAASGAQAYRAVPVEVWAYPEDVAWADTVPFRRVTEIAEVMQRLVGPYPFAKLAHVQSSTRYGGMENSGVIFYPESAYVERRLREGTVRHETAHQWFGDAVTARDWHHLWLSEGFASYFDLVIGAALDGDSVLVAGMRGAAERYRRSTPVVERPIVDTMVTDLVSLLNENNYQKGAWVLHMLRAELGDSAFFGGVRRYYRIYRDSTALSRDFQRVMERAAGRPLDWFFRQWLHQPGYPQLDVRWVADGASRQVVLYVRQAQPAAWGRFRVAAVPVVLVGVEGPARRTFALDPRYAEQVASFTVDRLPSDIRIDPEGTLLLTATVHR